MTQIITTSSTTSGINITAAANELISIADGVTRTSTDDIALSSTLGAAEIIVNGALVGASYGIALSDSADSTGNFEVTVGATGSVTAGGFGIFIFDSGNSLSNHGAINSSDTGIFSFGDDFHLTNTGTITSHTGQGVQSRGAGSVIVNYGLIQSLDDVAPGFYFWDDDPSKALTLTNYGTIAATSGTAVQGDLDDTDEIYNLGLINGNVRQMRGNDKFFNTGTVQGDVYLGGGTDWFDGRGGSVTGTVFGDEGIDVIFGGNGMDTLAGGEDRDVLRGGPGADTLDGGGGIQDWLDYRGSTARVVVNLGTGQADGGDASGDTFTGFERLLGSNLNDTLTGDHHNNAIRGHNGDDFLRGASGNDLIAGGRGADILDGGNGIDALDYRASSAGVSVDFSTDTVSGGDAEGDTIRNFERVYGSKFDDTFIGDANANWMVSVLGNDTFVFSSPLSASNIDTISGFDLRSDKIVLDSAIFDAVVQAPGQLLPGYYKENETGVATDANDRIIYDDVRGHLYYDADGNGEGAAVEFAWMHNVPFSIGFANIEII